MSMGKCIKCYKCGKDTPIRKSTWELLIGTKPDNVPCVRCAKEMEGKRSDQ